MIKSSLLTLYLIIFVLIVTGCNVSNPVQEFEKEPVEDIQITKYGSEQSLDIATWNIEFFPKSASYTIPYLRQIIEDIDIDIIAIQEIDLVSSFYVLLDSLEGYSGVVSEYPEIGLRLGILYKETEISITDPIQLFVDDYWAFPRPPLLTYVTVQSEGNIIFDFTLIINHLKAFGDNESVSRRRQACQKLKSYIDSQLLTSADQEVILLGDFNDEVNDPIEDNVFQPFITDSLNYQILTRSITDIPSYIGGFRSNIDHILITQEVQDEYNNGLTQILTIDQEFDRYVQYISDHRPVLTRFFIF